MKIQTLFLLAFLLFSKYGNAKVVKFYESGKFDSEYSTRITNLKYGDILEYPNGARFQFLKLLGEGGVSTILQVRTLSPELSKNTYALKIPKPEAENDLLQKHRRFLNYTIDNYEKVKTAGIRIPELYASSPGLYALFEEIPDLQTLKQFLSDPDNESKTDTNKKITALKQFAQNMKDIRRTGDFRTDQIAYSPKEKEWILMDWAVARALNELTGKELFLQTPFVEADFIQSTPKNPWAMHIVEELHNETASARRKDFKILCRSILTGIAEILVP